MFPMGASWGGAYGCVLYYYINFFIDLKISIIKLEEKADFDLSFPHNWFSHSLL